MNKVHEFVFAANQQQNETYRFKDAMMQNNASDFVIKRAPGMTPHTSLSGGTTT